MRRQTGTGYIRSPFIMKLIGANCDRERVDRLRNKFIINHLLVNWEAMEPIEANHSH